MAQTTYGTGFANNVTGGPYTFYQIPKTSYQEHFASVSESKQNEELSKEVHE
jgi:hypothetical protein